MIINQSPIYNNYLYSHNNFFFFFNPGPVKWSIYIYLHTCGIFFLEKLHVNCQFKIRAKVGTKI